MASIIKADNIQKVSDGTNIIKKCGSTITLGSCGATISLAAGATQTGFGQTYSAVEYCTTAKTSPFTAAAGTGYFVNTTCGAVTVTLPASPTAGDVVAFKDYAGQWNTNSVTLCNNGNKINGICSTASLSTQNQSVSLIYVDGTKGWQDIQDSTAGVSGLAYIVATGGTITTCGDYKIHTFTSDGTFCVSAANVPANAYVDYMVVAGGASGGGGNRGGGGGAGGYRESSGVASGCYSVSPLGACVSALPVSVTTYPVTVGGGGAAVPCGRGNAGSNSVFSTITSTGGGTGGANPGPSEYDGVAGGSGGGSGATDSSPTGGAGNTPPVSPPQGQNGGNSASQYGAGGGGGGGAVGGNSQGGSTPSTTGAGVGGAGVTSCITASPVTRAGGGGGGGYNQRNNGGSGGGGNGGTQSPDFAATSGAANTGGGGGGTGYAVANSGGSGIVIIRYKFQ
jgi:hypothetical protein